MLVYKNGVSFCLWKQHTCSVVFERATHSIGIFHIFTSIFCYAQQLADIDIHVFEIAVYYLNLNVLPEEVVGTDVIYEFFNFSCQNKECSLWNSLILIH